MSDWVYIAKALIGLVEICVMSFTAIVIVVVLKK